MHNIDMSHGRANIAYANEMPWHGLGKRVETLQTPFAVLDHAGLDWTVRLEHLFRRVANPDGVTTVGVSTHRAVVRQDTDEVLGVVTAQYHPIQNRQAAEIVDALVAEGQGVVEVAGSLGKGEKCWMLCRIPAEFEVTRGDEVRPYFLLAWGHDGKHGVAGKLTPVRVVCQNTLTAAFEGRWRNTADVFLRHRAGVQLRIDEARKALGLMRQQVDDTATVYRRLAATPMNSAVTRYFAQVFPSPEQFVERLDPNAEPEAHEQYARAMERWQEQQEALLQLFHEGTGAEFSRGTAWGAYNAVTEWVDHVYPVLKSGTTSTTRQESVLFGAYAETKRRALALLAQ